jgi:hypothetical protein
MRIECLPLLFFSCLRLAAVFFSCLFLAECICNNTHLFAKVSPDSTATALPSERSFFCFRKGGGARSAAAGKGAGESDNSTKSAVC